MAIQLRRGDHNDFDPSQLLAGELAAVLENDPDTEDGTGLYVSYGDNNVKRLIHADEQVEVPTATTSTAGIVKPDGTTITVDSDGTIHGADTSVYFAGSVSYNTTQMCYEATVDESFSLTSGVSIIMYASAWTNRDSLAKLSVNSSAVKNIKKSGGDVQLKYIEQGTYMLLTYNGTYWGIVGDITRGGSSVLAGTSSTEASTAGKITDIVISTSIKKYCTAIVTFKYDNTASLTDLKLFVSTLSGDKWQPGGYIRKNGAVLTEADNLKADIPYVFQYDGAYWQLIGTLHDDVPIATTSTAGIVKPDGTTITVDSDGTIHGAPSSVYYAGAATLSGATLIATVDSSFSLTAGVAVILWTTSTPSQSSYDSNMYLNVNSTGRKLVREHDLNVNLRYLSRYTRIMLVYDGTNWNLVGDVNRLDSKVFVGTSSTAASDAYKTTDIVTNGLALPIPHFTVIVTFDYDNTAALSNLRLAVMDTSGQHQAFSIRKNGAELTEDDNLKAGIPYLFQHDGSYWELIGALSMGESVSPSEATPEMDGTASAGTSDAYARGDHVHPTDTSRMAASLKGAANGVAELDASGKVPTAQLPSYVDDVLEYATASAFPATGEAGKIYVDLSTNRTYRWGGSSYVEISASLALGETSGTAYRGDHGKAAYDHAQARGSAFAGGLYKVQTNAEGHVIAATAVAKADITGLGIPEQDTTYGLELSGRTLSIVEGGTQDSVTIPLALLDYDAEEGRYTNRSVQAWLAAQADGRAYGVSIPKGSAVACTKTGANAGIANPVPGIVGTPAVDPYVGLGPFVHYDVNGYVDEDGTPHVTAIEGDGRFARDGSGGDVWVLCPTLWWAFDADGEDAVELSVSDTHLAGMSAQPQAYLPDGTLRPYMLYAKYSGGKGPDNLMHSYSGLPAWNYEVSHNTLITLCRTASTGYSGKSVADDWYLKVMFLLKYATKHSQSVLTGCTSYNYQYYPTVAETGVSRVIISKANAANLLVGSSMMFGTRANNNSDRGQATIHDIFTSLKVARIEAYDSNNSAVYFDTDLTWDTATTYMLSTAPWHSGACDGVEGDGSPTNCTNGREPFVLQGIETAVGIYEALGDIIVENTGGGWEVCINHDSRNEATGVTAAYTRTGKHLYADATDSWKYPMYPDSADGLLFGAGSGASQSTGMCDGTYTNKLSTTGTREWLGLGYLHNGGDAGVWCVNAGHGLGGAWWLIGSRLSATGRAA